MELGREGSSRGQVSIPDGPGTQGAVISESPGSVRPRQGLGVWHPTLQGTSQYVRDGLL